MRERVSRRDGLIGKRGSRDPSSCRFHKKPSHFSPPHAHILNPHFRLLLLSQTQDTERKSQHGIP